jgi:hypothetical protein
VRIERRDRPKDPHGGVLIAAKKQLQLGNITKSKDIELIVGSVSLEGKKKMLVGLVGKSTISSKPLSATTSRNVWLVLIGYCLFMMVCSSQLISGSLKSLQLQRCLVFN